MIGNYNFWLIFLSIVVATFASYVALDLASRVLATRGTWSTDYWLFGGAISMGTGIWSMHFIGMLAFQLPIPMSYDIPITLASLLIAVIVSGFALYTFSHGALGLRRLLGAGSLMGVGIACMHYTGMAAMQLAPPVRYNLPLFIASVVIAIAASVVALWIAFQLRTESILSAFWKKAGSALIMGFAITGMHYTGMAAAIFAPDSVCSVSPQDINNVWLAGAIGGLTFMLLATTLVISVFDSRTAMLNALRISEDRFRSLTGLSSDFFWETDTRHCIIETSHGFLHRSVNAPGSQIGKARWDIPSVSPDAAGWAAHRAVLDTRQPFREFELSRLDADGVERHLSISGEPVFDEDGTFKGYRGVGQDITARKRAEEELRSAVSLLSATLESTADGILVVAENHSISRFNQRFVEMWRIPAEIIDSRDDNRAIGFVLDQVKDTAAFIAKVEELYAHPEAESFDTIEFKDGRTFERYSRPQYVARRPVGRVWSFRDVTERRSAEQRIHALAFHDSLTELPNRVLFRDRMDQATAHADRARTKVALLFLDLDNFKTINDSLGHTVGDALLRMAATRLRRCLRDTDTISRQGGDEFLVMLTDLPEAEAATPVVHKLMEQFHVPFEIEGSELTTSVSIGIALYPDDGEDFDVLLKKADTAMYRAKDAGKNAYRFFDQLMNVEAVEHLSIRNGLRFAVERDELVLHYQPQFDLNSGEIIGAEALVRWNHPQRGMVLPERFIPIAEETGLIVPIGAWVLREACRQAATWHTAGRTGMVVAVNLSAAQFTRGGLEKNVIGALEETGIDPSMLELELTESILIRDTEATLATVKRLKGLGVRLSIDDFGTGYSSLSYLKRFEVDKLKIDQSFIRDLAINPEDAAIVRSIIQIARSLGLRTIAEGVEQESLLHFLRIYNCDEAQGYHFGRPMPAKDFTNYLLRDLRAIKKPPGGH